MKEIGDDTKKGKDIPCFWTERMNTVKMAILHKAIYRFNTIPITLPTAFLYGTIKTQYCQSKPGVVGGEAGGITLSEFRQS